MQKTYSNKIIRLISGEMVYREMADLVGRCNNCQHPGFLTRSIVKRKQCVKKNCKHFEAFWEEPFWSGVRNSEKKKEENKKEKKLAQLQRREQQAQTLSLLEDVMTFANWLIEAYDVPIMITGVARIGQTTGTPKLVVNYVTASASNDGYRYRDFGEMIAAHFQLDAEMRHTKLPDGRYATIKDFHCFTERRTG